MINHMYGCCYCYCWLCLDPFTRIAAGIQKVGFGASFFGMVVIFPTCRFGKTHQDGLDAASSLQTKNGSAVVDQVEFGVSATTQLLPALFLFGKVVILVLFNNRTIGSNDVIYCVFTEFKDLLRITVVEVVKENATETATFSAVFNQKVAIGPFLEFGVVFRVVTAADFFVGSMKVFHVV